jgi:hypothetical protein
MKSPLLPLAVLGGLAALTWLVFRDGGREPAVDPAPPAGQGSARQSWDPEEVFRRAFWRHPAPEDRVVHAERFEWKAEDGTLARWQWFLEVNPGPALLAFLRDPGTLGLLPADALSSPPPSAPPPGRPAWFPPAGSTSGFEVLRHPQGALTLLYRGGDNTLFATDAGHGFSAPVSND